MQYIIIIFFRGGNWASDGSNNAAVSHQHLIPSVQILALRNNNIYTVY